jgi:hypothetical protein
LEIIESLSAQIVRAAFIGENALVAQRLQTGDRSIQLARLEPLSREIAAKRLRIGEPLSQFAAVLP